MKTDYGKMVRQFILGENREAPDTFSYIQGIYEILERMRPHTVREQRSISLMQNHLKEIRRHTKRTMEENRQLQEQITLLEEEQKK